MGNAEPLGPRAPWGSKRINSGHWSRAVLVPSATSSGRARRAQWCRGAADDPGEMALCPALGEDVHPLKTQLFCSLGEIPWFSSRGQVRKGLVPAWVAGTRWHCDSRLESRVGLIQGVHSAFKADALENGAVREQWAGARTQGEVWVSLEGGGECWLPEVPVHRSQSLCSLLAPRNGACGGVGPREDVWCPCC